MQIFANWRLKGLERGLAALDRLAARRKGSVRRPEHLVTGERGEEAAFFFLRAQGCTVVAQRWNDGPLPGDIDLIAWDGDVLCFVEVKTRTSRDVTTASAAVDQNKRKTLRRLARLYLRHLPSAIETGTPSETEPQQTRFDIVTVYELPGQPRQMQRIPAAFGWSDHSLEGN